MEKYENMKLEKINEMVIDRAIDSIINNIEHKVLRELLIQSKLITSENYKKALEECTDIFLKEADKNNMNVGEEYKELIKKKINKI
ncbi:hypothetical protein [Clostridium felsineum]|uniref:Uncharacterized protein n=1 Tax=Clostridium felsineum TaxID=36839 RepID=A0A1S8M2H4_9CLOT|nr:hypothetical protein [Clostridium felsineum]URZ06784.1 hypothetical protein CLROS_021170 [Clostridium felsineum]URZ11816.1 hypothetical protein CROST_025330 [Clostridium felsineum]